jgi:hypothetical protein
MIFPSNSLTVNDCTLLALRKAYTSDFSVAMKFFNARENQKEAT